MKSDRGNTINSKILITLADVMQLENAINRDLSPEYIEEIFKQSLANDMPKIKLELNAKMNAKFKNKAENIAPQISKTLSYSKEMELSEKIKLSLTQTRNQISDVIKDQNISPKVELVESQLSSALDLALDYQKKAEQYKKAIAELPKENQDKFLKLNSATSRDLSKTVTLLTNACVLREWNEVLKNINACLATKTFPEYAESGHTVMPAPSAKAPQQAIKPAPAGITTGPSKKK